MLLFLHCRSYISTSSGGHNLFFPLINNTGSQSWSCAMHFPRALIDSRQEHDTDRYVISHQQVLAAYVVIRSVPQLQ